MQDFTYRHYSINERIIQGGGVHKKVKVGSDDEQFHQSSDVCANDTCTPFSMDISSIRLQIVDKTQPARTITAIIQDEGFSLCEMGADFKELIETM
jgi:hypothetical protein